MLKRLSSSDAFVRAVGTVLYGALFIWLFLVDGVPLFIGVAAVTLIAAYEFYRMMTHGGHQPSFIIGIAASLFFVADAYFERDLLRPGLTLILLASAAWYGIKEARRQAVDPSSGHNYATDWALTLVGALYTGGLLSYAISLRALPDGARLLITVAAGAAACDIAAYAIGSSISKHPFLPSISPRKTWEGTIAGFLAAVVVVASLAAHWGASLPIALGWGIVLGFFQIQGDLVESKLKRIAGVKDSGSLIPAQGGILDVIDGFMFSIAVSYYYLVLIAHLS